MSHVAQRAYLVQPGDDFAPVIAGTPPWRVCAGTLQAVGGTIELGYLGSDQAIITLTALAAWDVDGQDLTRLIARQGISGGTATLGFSGSVYADGGA